MKTRILSWSATDEYAKLVKARRIAEGMTGSEYMRKCVREEAERAAAHKILSLNQRGNGMDLRSLLASAGA